MVYRHVFGFHRKTLEHGKHVLVDFPLSLTAQSGKELFKLADSKGMNGDLLYTILPNYTWVDPDIFNDLFRIWVVNLTLGIYYRALVSSWR